MKTKRILSLLLALTIVLSVPVTASASTGYELVEKIPGGGKTEFVSKLAGIEVEVPEDMDKNYVGYIKIALKHNLIPEEMKARYDEPITRGELATLIVRFYEQVKGKEISARKKLTDTKAVEFEKIAGLGIITGVGYGTFRPNDILTQEQVVVTLYRLMEKLDYRFQTANTPKSPYDASYDENYAYFMGEAKKSGVSSWALDRLAKVSMESILWNSYTFEPKGNFTVVVSITHLIRIFEGFDNMLFEGYSSTDEAKIKDLLKQIEKMYPTGTPWGYEKHYIDKTWGTPHTVTACDAFQAMVSDYIFGDLPKRSISSSFDSIRVGDELIVNSGSHTVIVIDKTDKGVVVAEGNNEGKVKWGKIYTPERFERAGAQIITRYPEVYNSRY